MSMKDIIRGKVAKLLATTGGGASALAIAFVMVSGNDGLEGREHYAYKDPIGILTVCDGHTGSDIIAGRYYSDQECDAITKSDLLKVEKQVKPLILVDMANTQLAAIYSFVYNVGIGNFKSSTMLKMINSRDRVGACDQLLSWVYAGGKKWKGLMTRREIEQEICKWTKQPVKNLIEEKDSARIEVNSWEDYTTVWIRRSYFA